MVFAPLVEMNDGRSIPVIGFGVWQVPDDVVIDATLKALEVGYRHIDTACVYENERGVGEALRRSGLNRDDVFVTTKVWNTDQGYDQTLRAFDTSTGLLGIDEVDLYLIHWPTPARDLYLDSWRALIRLREEGRARSIGVSNFHEAHLRRIVDETGVIPAINQIELHPWLPQTHMRSIDAGLGIKTEAWSPLGSGQLIDDPVIAEVAAKHTPNEGVAPDEAAGPYERKAAARTDVPAQPAIPCRHRGGGTGQCQRVLVRSLPAA